MLLYLAETMHKLRVDPEYFFRMAHQWRFNRDVSVAADVLAYEVVGIVPPYVREYVVHIQQTEEAERRQTNVMPQM